MASQTVSDEDCMACRQLEYLHGCCRHRKSLWQPPKATTTPVFLWTTSSLTQNLFFGPLSRKSNCGFILDVQICFGAAQGGTMEDDSASAVSVTESGDVVLAGYTSGNWTTQNLGGSDFAAVM